MAIRTLAGVPAKSPSETVKSKGIVLGIMGLPYSGKSTLAKTAPTPLAGFDLSGGLYVLEDKAEDIQIWAPQDWNSLNAMLTELERDPAPFKSIWTDVVTMVQEESVDHHSIHLVSSTDTRQRQIRWGESNWDVVQYHRRLMNLAEQKGVNIFFVYWTSRPVEIEGGENRLRTRHMVLSPTVSIKVEGMLDLLVYIEKAPGNKPYPPIMRLDGDASIATKIRLPESNPLKHWKDVVECTPTILSDMVDAFHGVVDERYMK